jgi:ABC-type nitrate/sulfonate/bicarbonate transport system substrate-binding protein
MHVCSPTPRAPSRRTLNMSRYARLALGAAFGALVGLQQVSAVAAGPAPVKVRLSIDEDPIVVRLAESLGYFKQEGIEIVLTPVESVAKDDYFMQEPLMKGQLDASFHWFNHTIFGARHGFPVQAVMLFNDAPAMTVLVANARKDAIHGPADFQGKNVAEGAGYGTKAVITGYLTQQAGLPPKSYKPVMLQHDGRQEAIQQGLKDGVVDVVTCQEPMTSVLLATKLVSKLYDLNSKAATMKVLGAAFPAQSLMMSPDYIAAHPGTAQHLVNAFVRAMRFINSHGVDEIVATLPPEYFKGKDRNAEIQYIQNTASNFVRGDYSFSKPDVELVIKAVQSSQFDDSEEGQWRAGGDNSKVIAETLYTNALVTKAMAEIK